MAILTVGRGKQYDSLSEAIDASRDGDTIQVQAGVYENDFAVIDTRISIIGVGGMAHLKATKSIPNGKGILVTNADVTLENIEFSGARVSAHNGAGIRYQAGDLTVRNSYFHDNENGILAAPKAGGSVTILNSEFSRNGYGDGYTHAIYVNQVDQLTVRDSYFHDTREGHHIKSRAKETIVEDSRLDDGSGTSSYAIDLPNGGKALISGNILLQGSKGHNPAIINYGGEGSTHSNSSLTVDDNVFGDALKNGVAVYNRTPVNARITDNDTWQVETLVRGKATSSGNTSLSKAPEMDSGHPWDDAPASRPEPAPKPAPRPAPDSEEGQSSGPDANTAGLPQSDTPTHAVRGGAGADRLNGTAAADRLDGGGGNDTMSGGAGDDTYHVGIKSDVVIEAAGGGVDTVVSRAKYFKLPDNVENLILEGSFGSRGDGNGLDNLLIGSDGNSFIRGGGGDDVIIGGRGEDWLYGEGGSDTFIMTHLDGFRDLVRDFTPGEDRIDLRPLLDSLKIAGDPVASGHLRLTQSEGDTVIQIDRDGWSDGLHAQDVAVVEDSLVRLLKMNTDVLI